MTRRKGDDTPVIPGKVLVGRDAIDRAKSIADDPGVNARPENREVIKLLLACIDRAEKRDG